MQVDFYQLGATPLERVLPRIAERVLAAGQRLLVVADDADLLARLDLHLWNYSPASFLPHAIAGTGGEASQPILLAATIDPQNGARNVALADGLWRDAALGFDRIFLFFDESSVAGARLAWKTLAGRDDLTRNYWRQDEQKRWQRVA